MAVAVTDAAIGTMDVEFYTVTLGGRTSLLDSLRLRVCDSRDSVRVLATPSPLIAMRHNMNWLRHGFMRLAISPVPNTQPADQRHANWQFAQRLRRVFLQRETSLEENVSCLFVMGDLIHSGLKTGSPA